MRAPLLSLFLSLSILWVHLSFISFAEAEEGEERFSYRGELGQQTGYRVGTPKNFSLIRQFTKLDLKTVYNDYIQIKIGGRAYYDAVYDLTDQYPEDVEDNMRREFALRDAYLDFSFPSVNLRVGHQQIVWGEALGQFFADVVNPKDLREFLLPAFEDIRIPIWAIDVRYTFAPNTTVEGVLSPDQTVSKVGLPGSNFAPFIPLPPFPFIFDFLEEDRPETDFKNWNGGGRFSYLVNRWDFSWFYFTSPDHLPAIFKTIGVDVPLISPTIVIQPRHKRVHNFGTTISREVGAGIVRSEFVFTAGRFFNANTPFDLIQNEGVIKSNHLRYVVGFDYTIVDKIDLNSEFQQEFITTSSDSLTDDRLTSWIFLRLTTDFFDRKLTPELIFIVGLDGGDTQISPRLSYKVIDPVLLTWGADIFSGPEGGRYGQFDAQDRIYMSTRFFF